MKDIFHSVSCEIIYTNFLSNNNTHILSAKCLILIQCGNWPSRREGYGIQVKLCTNHPVSYKHEGGCIERNKGPVYDINFRLRSFE